MRRASSRFLPPFAPLAGSLLLILAPAIAGHADESAVAAPAATITVTNCNNGGPGSLRAAVANAANGDRIDLTALTCNRIVLTSGAIQVPQNNLELIGRGYWALTIDGNRGVNVYRGDRVFTHTGTGTLRLRRVSIANGYLTGSQALGGCIYSPGNVELIGSRLHHCELRASGGLKPVAGGGGIYAERVLLSYSSASSNVAVSNFYEAGGAVRATEIVLYHSQVHGNRSFAGGGVYGARVTASYSVISGNEGHGIAIFSDGCGPPAVCTLTLNKSTVSANRGGGIWAASADDVAIIESTVSDNVAYNWSAAILPSDGETRIFNSTIAFNQEQPTGSFAECRGAIGAYHQLRLESSIVARNTCSLIGDDYDISGDPSLGAQIVGGNNIIGYSELPVPPDTISARPRLGPLTDNGGPTPTRKPHADSPALDRGSNLLNRQYDQRGPGFPRVKGGFPDIGAVER